MKWGGVANSTEQITQSTSGGTENGGDNNNDNNNAGANGPVASDPGNTKTPDIVVSEDEDAGNEQSPAEQPTDPDKQPENPEEKSDDPDKKPENSEEKPTDPEQQPENPEENPVDPEQQPVNPDKGSENPDQVTEDEPSETDPSLQAANNAIATLQANSGIMPMILDKDTDCTIAGGAHSFVQNEYDDELGIESTGDQNGHWIRYRHVVEERCVNCYVQRKFEAGEIQKKQVEHDFVLGVCKYCGYVCKHEENSVHDADPSTYTVCVQTSDNNNMHKKMTYKVQTVTCKICKLEAETIETLVDTVYEEHTAKPGSDECECGATVDTSDTCPQNPEEGGHHWVPDTSTYIEDDYLKYEPSDDGKYCVGVGRVRTTSERCSYCGIYREITDVDEDATTKMTHSFYSEEGYTPKCTRCGYVRPECEHPNMITYDSDYDDNILDAEATNNENGTHTLVVIKYISRYCPDCGYEEDLKEEEEVTEDCRMENAGDKLVCSVCGYSVDNTCKHENKRLIEEWKSGCSREDDPTPDEGGRTHTYPQTYVEELYYCPDCGRDFEVDYILPVPYVEEHDLYDVNGSVYCYECSYEKKCDHEDATVKSEEYNFYFQSLGASGHKCITEWRLMLECPTCGIRKSVGHDTSTSTTEEHSFDPWTGVCYACGYKNTCAHNFKPAKYPMTNYWSYEQIPGNAKYHIATYTLYTTEECTKCGQERLTNPKEMTENEDHEWDKDGKCIWCGYSKNCDHAEKTFGTPTSFTKIEEIPGDNSNHRVTYFISTPWTCKKCNETGVTITEDPDHKSTTEEHNYIDYVDEDGEVWCRTCYHVCNHSDVTKEPSESEEAEPYAIDDDYHCTITTVTNECTCNDCGQVWTEDGTDTSAVGNEQKELHTYVQTTGTLDGSGEEITVYKCSVCGHVCQHEGATVRVDPKTDKPTSVDAKTHATTTTTTTTKTCTHGQDASGEKGHTIVETATSQPKTENHTFDATTGKCSVCGYECKHDADGFTLRKEEKLTDTPVYEEIPGNNREHYVSKAGTVVYTCPNCLHERSEPLSSEKQLEAHTYNAQGVCVCGHKCNHELVDPADQKPPKTVSEVTKAVEIAGNDAQHNVVVETTLETHCPYCNAVTKTETKTSEPTLEKHHYGADFTCTDCGHECKHQLASGDQLKAVTVSEVKKATEIEGNDLQHNVVVEKKIEMHCPYCDKVKETKTETSEPTLEDHSYGADGACTVAGCAHKCGHNDTGRTPHTLPPVIEKRVEDKNDDVNHKIVGTQTTEQVCGKCHQVVESNTVPYEGTEAHKYVDGVCTVAGCEHECTHSHKNQPVTEFVPDGNYKSNGSKGHTASGREDQVTYCADCKMEVERVEGTEPVTQEQKHNFKNGKCTLCGYVKPAPAEDDKQDEASDEPVFEPVAPGTPMHGVNVGDGTRMATALGKAVEGIQAEYGADVSIFVRDADKILSTTEYKTLNTLPVREQILVVLTALGYREEVTNGLEELGIELSREAHGLIGQIALRLAGMSETEKAEFLELLAKYFQATVDADEQHTEIVLEIRVKLDEGYRMERYSFDLKDGAWVFSALAVAGAE